MNLKTEILKMAQGAQKASYDMALVATEEKNAALKAMAGALLHHKEYLKSANEKDLKAARKSHYSKALVDRLTLSDKILKEMAESLQATAALKDPVGEILSTIKRPNGLLINKVRVPIGVVGIIYESRPNVTSDCIGLCLKSGNAAILKGGREAVFSNRAVFKVIREALRGTKIPLEAINFISSADRQAVRYLLELKNYVDLIVPRGGDALIGFVVENTKIPVVKHDKGICHTYVSEHADLNMAHHICYNAKVQKPGVCNAMETLLVHREVAPRFLPSMIDAYKKAGVQIRGDETTRRIVKSGIKKATSKDWDTEYLDLILSVKVIDSLKGAIDHINTHGSHHSDAIVTGDKSEAERFLKSVDSACLYVNASTRFTDGSQFGMGAEIGISTDKLHARGPMALEGLTTYKYTIFGEGQIRQ